MMKTIKTGISEIIIFLLCFLASITSLRGERYKVALVHSFEKGYASAEKAYGILSKELRNNYLHCDIKEYFLDCEGFEEAMENEHMSEFVDDIAMWGADLIAVLDDQATYAIMACNNPKVRQIPVVFSGVNYPNTDLLEQYPNVTGYADIPDYFHTVQMIERIMGKTRVCLLNGSTFLDRKIWKAINDQCEGKGYKIIYTDKELMEHVKAHKIRKKGYGVISFEGKYQDEMMDSTAIVKMATDYIAIRKVMWVGFGSGTVFLFTKRDYTTLHIAALFRNPCFETINEGFGIHDYMMGGYFAPLETQLRDMAAGIAERLRGEMPEQQVRHCEKKYVVNWHTLQKYQIPQSDIPREYTVMYIPFTVRYHKIILCGIILAGISVMSFIGFLVFSLLRERKRKRNALHSLRYEHETLRLAIEGADTYAWRLDGDVVVCDAQFCDLIHHTGDRVSLSELLSFVHPDDKERFRQNFLQTRNHSRYKGQYRCCFGGTYQWWELCYKAIHMAGHISVITGLLQNIQDIKDREEELIQARELAERAELKQSFLNNMSHEIRTPLNAIVGFSNILTGDSDFSEEEKREFVRIINTNTELLLKLISDVLELSRLESGALTFNFKEESLRSMLESFYQTYCLQVSPDLKFIKDFPAEDVKIYVDRMRMQQVITNFLHNANKFTTSGYLKLGYYHRPEDKCVRIYVEDTGKGIPLSEQKMIFERFYKHDEFVQGTGLGLSICRGIVEKMNGHIEVESEEDKGSRFTVVLPVV